MENIWGKRGSDEFPRQFVPAEVDLGEWDRIEPLFENLAKRELSGKETLERWLLDLSELEACLDEEGSRRYIAMTCDTENEEHERAYLHFISEVVPKIKPWTDKLNRRFLDSSARTRLDGNRYQVLDRDIENEVKLFREENVPLQTEDDQLRQKYQKVCGGMTVRFEGEEKTIPQMRKYQEFIDREVRRSAWEATSERYLDDCDEIDAIYDHQIRVRNQIGEIAGFSSYRDYVHQAKGRFDYTPEDCFDFHRAIENEVVPLLRALGEIRQEKLGVASLRPWDLQVDPEGRPPLEPFEQEHQLIEGCQDIFNRVDAELAGQFNQMREVGLLDLSSRKGKAPGGYQSGLEEMRLPFIFMNASGTDGDVYTLLHEGGHAFHSFACRAEPLTHYRSAPIEFAEVASMTMELFALPFLDAFYSAEEAERSKRTHLEGILKVLCWIATIDAFQHWVYLHPGHSREERREKWVEIQTRFGGMVDWTGYEEAQRCAWHRQLHPFTVPFYYIEYGIAQLGALQIWLRSREDFRGAVTDYKKSLSVGGSRPLPELFEAAGARFSFNQETVAPLAERLAKELGLST